MFFIRLWLACATPKKDVHSTPSVNTTNLETIDLRLEFGDAYQGWYYLLNQIDIVEGMNVSLQSQTGWAAINVDSEQLLGTGFAPESYPSEICVNGCRLLTATIRQSNGSESVPPQSDQELNESAPAKSAGLTMIETWSQPLTGMPALDKQLRLRAVTLEPKGNVGQHKHNGRPSFAYIVSGDLIEHRGDGDGSYTEGSRVAERSGWVHWWENGETPATIVVFDIIDAE